MSRVEFSPRCDGCHDEFKEGGDGANEPVSVGCFHTLCRACAEGHKGAYGALEHLAGEGRAEEGRGFGLGARQGLVRGRCGVCGGGNGGQAELQRVVLEAMRWDDSEGEGEGEGKEEEGGVEGWIVCEVCSTKAQEGEEHAASHWCKDCAKHMCGPAAQAHAQSTAHSVERAEGAKQPPVCPSHHRPLGNIFCKRDRRFLCAVCVDSDHRGHDVVAVGEELVGTVRGWLAVDIASAVTRVGELEGAEGGLVEGRARVMASARQAIDGINAVFDELECKREELIDEVAKVRKEACQRLNDVRTTSRLLRQGIQAVERALHALAGSPEVQTVQGAEQMGQHLRVLVERSKQAHTSPGSTVPAFRHSKGRLNSWCDSLRSTASAAYQLDEPPHEEWEARRGVLPQPLPSLIAARDYHAATVTRANEVLVVGGRGRGGQLNSVERLGDGASAWRAGLTIPTSRKWCGACAVGDTVVVVGGFDNGANLDVVEAVDTASGAHTTLPPLPRKVRGCRAVGVGTRVLVTGGYDGSGIFSNLWALDVGSLCHHHQQQQAPQWTLLPSMVQARCYHGAAAGGGCIFVCGGSAGDQPLDSCEMLQVGGGGGNGGGWELLTPMPKRLRDVGCCFGGGNVFVAGGFPGAQRSVLALDVEARKWTQVAELGTGRFGCAAVCVGRRVMVLGGWNKGELRSCEVLEF